MPSEVMQLQELTIAPEATLLQAVEQLNRCALQILLVMDETMTLLGTITDGDIRRSILRGGSMDDAVSAAINDNPVVLPEGSSRADALALMQLHVIHAVPVVNGARRVVGLETETRLLRAGIEETWVVLMAGGLGTRLRPLTEDMPKPLLPVGGRPILERILDRFLEQGFRRFFISVNYKAEMIQDYFGDGSQWGCDIFYLREKKRLGTAGALSLLPAKNSLPEHILVMNGDLLTTMDFRQLLDFHRSMSGDASMCVRDYSIEVPYGVVQVDGHRYCGLKEKPAHHYYINAGIYVLSSDMLARVPTDCYYDITALFDQMHRDDRAITVFPMREQWMDIGSAVEYERANGCHLQEVNPSWN